MPFKSLIIAVAILLITHFFNKKRVIGITARIDSLNFKIVFGVFLLLLLILYVFPASYYYPTNNGVLGDNYFHLEKALLDSGYLKHHHLLFPLLSEKFIRLMIDLNLLSTGHPEFLEQVFFWSILPISLTVASSISFFSFLLWKRGIPISKWITIALLVFTSYGLWLWSIQSNAIGLALAMELFIATLFISWYKTRKPICLSLLSFLIGLSVFTHNGLIYAALGSYITIIYVLVSDRARSKPNIFVNLIVSNGILILMGAIYYFIQAELNDTYEIARLFSILSDSNYFGSFADSELNIIGAIEANFWAGINWVTGFYYVTKYPYWSVKQVAINLPLGSVWLKAMQIGSVFAILMTILLGFFKNTPKPSRELFLFGIINSILFLAGFTLRQAGTHYYVLALIPNLILIISFIIGETPENRVRFQYALPIILIAVGHLYFNFFTNISVFEGKDINEHPYYSESNQINGVSNGKNVIYFSRLDMDYYPNLAMSAYYKSKFGKIKWSSDWDSKASLLSLISKAHNDSLMLMFNRQAYDLIKDEKELQFELVEGNNYIVSLKSTSP